MADEIVLVDLQGQVCCSSTRADETACLLQSFPERQLVLRALLLVRQHFLQCRRAQCLSTQVPDVHLICHALQTSEAKRSRTKQEISDRWRDLRLRDVSQL